MPQLYQDRWVADSEDMKTQHSSAHILPVGTSIERRIDADWFFAVVIDGYLEDTIVYYDIEYRDDGNREIAVPASEVQLARNNTSRIELPEAQPPLSPEIESIKCVSPIARVHGQANDDASDTTFVVNGPSTKLGAGGGIHGIRFLRESVNM